MYISIFLIKKRQAACLKQFEGLDSIAGPVFEHLSCPLCSQDGGSRTEAEALLKMLLGCHTYICTLRFETCVCKLVLLEETDLGVCEESVLNMGDIF